MSRDPKQLAIPRFVPRDISPTAEQTLIQNKLGKLAGVQQLEFNLDIVGAVLSDMSAERDGDVRTWFLLYYRSETAGLRAEVSLPVRVHDRGVVDKWSDRIILDPLTFDPATVIPQDAGVNDDVEFDIEAI